MSIHKKLEGAWQPSGGGSPAHAEERALWMPEQLFFKRSSLTVCKSGGRKSSEIPTLGTFNAKMQFEDISGLYGYI